MKRTILNLVATVLAFALPLIVAPAAYAACPSSSAANTSKQQILNGVGDTGGDCSGSGVDSMIKAVVQIISIIAGIIAIIMILIASIKFMTSGGDSAKAASARSTLAYALIGIAVAVLTQFIVRFALTVGNNSVKVGGIMLLGLHL